MLDSQLAAVELPSEHRGHLDHPLGTPDDLHAHQQLLDATAAQVPVLPLRFGAAMATLEAVAGELLAVHHERFAAALAELEGRAE